MQAFLWRYLCWFDEMSWATFVFFFSHLTSVVSKMFFFSFFEVGGTC